MTNSKSGNKSGSEGARPPDQDASKPETAAAAEAPAAAEPAVSELRTELASVKDQLLRALAEQQNIRKRAQRELQDALKFAGADLAGEILAVADNLRRATENAPPEDPDPAALRQWIEGVAATERALLDVLGRHGISRFDPLGEAFDPSRHQALFQTADESTAPGTVTQVVQPGYMHHDRLLRPAMVGVSAGPTGEPERREREPARTTDTSS